MDMKRNATLDCTPPHLTLIFLGLHTSASYLDLPLLEAPATVTASQLLDLVGNVGLENAGNLSDGTI